MLFPPPVAHGALHSRHSIPVTDEVADWDAFYVGDCFASVPMATFLYGPLSVEKKKIARRQGQRRQAPEGEAARPTQVSEEMLEAEKCAFLLGKHLVAVVTSDY